MAEKCTVPMEKIYKLLGLSPAVMIAAHDEPWPQICTAAWCTTLDFDPPKATVVLSGGNATAKAAVKSGELSINIPDSSLVEKVNAVGTTSGRKIDKFREFGLTIERAERITAPLIGECVANLECRLIEPESELSRSAREKYDILFLEIVAARAKEDAFENGWKFAALSPTSGLRLLHHLGSNRFVATGEVLEG